jgi:hypothetical protein
MTEENKYIATLKILLFLPFLIPYLSALAVREYFKHKSYWTTDRLIAYGVLSHAHRDYTKSEADEVMK